MIPVILLLYLFSAQFEARLLMDPNADSFDYLYETLRESDEPVYDPERNVMVVNGKEYPPESVPNPEYLTGASRIGAVAFEVIDPWSGSPLELAREIAESESASPGRDLLPAWFLALYAVKALLWIAASALPGAKRGRAKA